MKTILNEVETRVVSCLVEKELTTPDYYPLTMNALIAACNQKSSREPTVSYDEDTVETALQTLRDKNLVYVYYGSSNRVPKYKHMVPSYYELEPSEVAVVCLLMLRGPQTIGELNQRSTRLYEFSGLDEVNETLDALMRREEPIIKKLDKQPGQKEARFAQLLAGDVESFEVFVSSSRSVKNERIEQLEEEVGNLRTELDELKNEFAEFKKQFE